MHIPSQILRIDVKPELPLDDPILRSRLPTLSITAWALGFVAPGDVFGTHVMIAKAVELHPDRELFER
jgi:hypothetical protein